MSTNIVKNTRIVRILLFLLIFTAAIMLSPIGIMQVNADAIMTTVSVGNLPQRVVVNETTNRIYVSSGNIDMYPSPIAGKVTVIDGSDYSVLDTLDVGNTPKGMAVDEANNKIYVANMRSSSVMVIDGNTNAVSTLPASINRPIAVAWNATANLLYVASNINDGGFGLVTVYNSSGTEVATINVDEYPSAIALDTTTNRIYVAHEKSPVGTVTVINGFDNSIVDILEVGAYPESIAVNETTHKIYVPNSGSNSVSVIDGTSNTVVETISAGNSSWGVDIYEAANKIYLTNQNGNVSVIDGTTDTVIQTLDLEGYANPIDVTVDQIRNIIYVPSLNANNLTVIDGSVIETVSVTGLTVPEEGAAPQEAEILTPGDGRYTVASLSWKNLNGTDAIVDGSGNFANAGNTYKAEIVLTAESGYKFPASGLTPSVNEGIPTDGGVSGGDVPGNSLTFEVSFPADITTASLGGLEAPAAGATPTETSELTSGDPVQYTLTSITWEDTGGTPANFADTSGKFPYGGSGFQARIVLTAQPGYKFPTGGLTPVVDGDGTAAAGTVGGGDVAENTLTFVATFSDELLDYEVSISDLNPPAPGEMPQVAGDLTPYNSARCYVSGLTWQNSDGSPATLSGGMFITGGSTYRAVIEMTSQPGYKFPQGGITPAGIYYDGTFVSGTVSGGHASGNKFTYIVTFSNEITTVGVTGLVAPVKGAVPGTYEDLTSDNTVQYDIDYMEWRNSDDSGATLTDGKFNASSTYKAVIYLQSNYGYKFPLSNLTPSVNAGTPTASSASYSESGNSLMFGVTFPATASDITVPVDPGTSDGGGSSSSGGGGGIPQEPQRPVGDTTGNTYTATTTVTANTDNSGKTTVAVTQTQVNDAVNKAIAEADKQGSGAKAVVEIKVETANSGNVNSVATSIPKDAVGLAINGGMDEMKVSTPVASLSFDTAALSKIFGESVGDVNITISKTDASSLSDETKQLVGDRPVFNFSVTSGNNTIAQFGGNVSVAVPYTPKAGEDTDAIVIYYINSEGKPEAVANCKYDPATKTVSFITDHFSQFAVAYNKVSFGDVKAGAWYESAVNFAAARGIVTGTGGGNFSPDGKLTRGQLLVMLMRAYGVEPDTDLSNNFSDAGSTYYTGYLAAAKRLGITEGLGNNLYAPGKQITRQEMFTLMYNTLKVIGQLPEGAEKSGGALTGYNDADSVASWAKDASVALADAGVIGGSNGKLSPKKTTSRAEMAQVIYNLLSK